MALLGHAEEPKDGEAGVAFRGEMDAVVMGGGLDVVDFYLLKD